MGRDEAHALLDARLRKPFSRRDVDGHAVAAGVAQVRHGRGVGGGTRRLSGGVMGFAAWRGEAAGLVIRCSMHIIYV